ncbi:hypothetical protein N7461_002741 [Penicillium sp. DV-2018c]|nr:hypothetical protein N7461_002741 [Penicillium sp. DV-2018c]
MAKVPIWVEDPLSFFSEDESQLELKSSPLDEMNAYMNKLIERTGMNTLRLRLLKVMYYRLSGWVGWTQLLHERSEHMAQITSNSDVSAWISEGKRIDNLCRDIGCAEKRQRSGQYLHLGNLFYSLQDVADYCIKEFPVKGDVRSEEIARLKRRNDLSLAEDRKKLDILAHTLTNTIWSALLDAESGLDSERPSSHSGPSTQQECRTPEEAVFTRGFPVCSTLDQECILADENSQPMLQQTHVDGALSHGSARSVSRLTGQFETNRMANPAQCTQTDLLFAGTRPRENTSTHDGEGNDKGGQTQNEEYISGSTEEIDSSFGEALENGSCLSRFNLHSIDALYDPRPNAQLIGPEYSSVSNVRQLDSLYDPRLNMQQIDFLYDPRLNMQQIDSLYDPRFNVQPIVDTPFTIQPDFVDSFGSSMQHVTAVIGVQNDGQIVNQPSSQSATASSPSFHAPIFSSNFSSSHVPPRQVPECSA